MDNMTKVLIKNKLLTFQFKDTGLDKKRFDKKKKNYLTLYPLLILNRTPFKSKFWL